MEQNACGLDRAVRLVLGSLLVAYALGVAGRRDSDDRVSPARILLTYLGAELLVTGLTQWCPANALLGRDTCA